MISQNNFCQRTTYFKQDGWYIYLYFSKYLVLSYLLCEWTVILRVSKCSRVTTWLIQAAGTGYFDQKCSHYNKGSTHGCYHLLPMRMLYDMTDINGWIVYQSYCVHGGRVNVRLSSVMRLWRKFYCFSFLFPLFWGSGLDINVPIGGAANFPAGHFTHVFIDDVGIKVPDQSRGSKPILTEQFEFESITVTVFGGQLMDSKCNKNPYLNPRRRVLSDSIICQESISHGGFRQKCSIRLDQ